jgi:aryl-alcohol dehydrogenase-like predicted oxidoreductase
MKTTSLGNTGPKVFPVALGCMGMSGAYGPADDAESIATIREAIERGVTLLDTADFYANGHNEMLIARAIEGLREKVQLSVKFGAMRGPDGAWLGFDGRPSAVKNFVTYSLRRLRVDFIDVYRPARLDPAVPIEDTVGAIADLVKAGFVRSIGLSEVGAETIRRAAKVHPLSDLQIEYAIVTRAPEKTIFPTLAELGMSATLYGVLSRGLLTGAKAEGNRAMFPRFAGEAGARNAEVIKKFRAFAEARGMTPAQLSVAWVLAKQPALVPVVGARTRKQLLDVLGALEKPLSPADVVAVEAILPPDAITGARYPDQQMKLLDSEREPHSAPQS